MDCSTSAVFPQEAGPKISVMKPRAQPPTPRAASSEANPVGRTSVFLNPEAESSCDRRCWMARRRSNSFIAPRGPLSARWDRPRRRRARGRGFRHRRRLRLQQAQRFPQFGVESLPDVRIVFQELARVLAALANAIALVAEPGSALLDDVLRDAEIDQVAFPRDAFPVNHVELGFAEWRGDFILDYLDLGPPADYVIAVLDRGDAPDVQPHRSVELQGAAAGGGFRVPEHHADFFADLVDEDEARPGFRYDAREFAESLGHQPRLQPHMTVAHLAIEFGFGNQGRH